MSRIILRKFSNYIKYSKEIQEALQNGNGVVALESTVITHGLPYPHNINTAIEMEEQVRSTGCFPATIAIINGNIHVGLEKNELENVAKSSGSVKVSTRDIAKTIVKKQLGGTTVAATMKIAHAAGIQVFATGGIGGVHRGAIQTFDISADLQELSKTPVCVVCSGIKSILDVPKTVEYMETHSVNCFVYNDENVFPNFFTQKSECKGQLNTKDLNEIVELLETSNNLGLPYGTVLACPIPEKFAADGYEIQKAIDIALEEVKERKISSNMVTPYILSRINELTSGASMKTNIALLKNNAKIAGKLANVLSQKKREIRKSSPIVLSQRQYKTKKPLVVSIGATIVDFEAITTDDVKEDGGSYKGEVIQRLGGVARNHADALARLGCDSKLISAIGDDENGEFVRRNCQHIDISRVEIIFNHSTCTYLSMNSNGNVKYGITNCDQLLAKITPELVTKNEEVIKSSEYIVLDCNLPVSVIDKALEMSKKHGKNVWIDPTDIKKVERIFQTSNIDGITAASPNMNEFLKWAQFCNVELNVDQLATGEMTLEFIDKNREKLMKNLEFLVVSLAKNGTVIAIRKGNNFSGYVEEAPVNSKDLVSVSGAGDCFNSGLISGIVHRKSIEECIQTAQRCAGLTLQSTLAVSDKITSI